MLGLVTWIAQPQNVEGLSIIGMVCFRFGISAAHARLLSQVTLMQMVMQFLSRVLTKTLFDG